MRHFNSTASLETGWNFWCEVWSVRSVSQTLTKFERMKIRSAGRFSPSSSSNSEATANLLKMWIESLFNSALYFVRVHMQSQRHLLFSVTVKQKNLFEFVKWSDASAPPAGGCRPEIRIFKETSLWGSLLGSVVLFMKNQHVSKGSATNIHKMSEDHFSTWS